MLTGVEIVVVSTATTTTSSSSTTTTSYYLQAQIVPAPLRLQLLT